MKTEMIRREEAHPFKNCPLVAPGSRRERSFDESSGPGRCNQSMNQAGEETLTVCGLQAPHCSCREGVKSRFCPASDKLKSTAQAVVCAALINVHFHGHPLYLGLLLLLCAV